MSAKTKKKTSRLPARLDNDKKARDTIKALKTSLSEASRNFTEGAEKVADAVVYGKNKIKSKSIKDETVATFKDIGRSIKKNMKGVKLRDVFLSIKYGIGRLANMQIRGGLRDGDKAKIKERKK